MSAVGFQSDSQILVETCLARLRVEARLDDEPVLPAIEDLVPYGEADEEVFEVRTDEIIVTDAAAIPSAASIVRASARANAQASASAKAKRLAPTMLTKPRPRRPARWPVVLCALVATYCGITAFLRSPLAAEPRVAHGVRASRAALTGVVDSAVETARSVSGR